MHEHDWADRRNPEQGEGFSHYVEIGTPGPEVVEGRPGVFVNPDDEPLDRLGRIANWGRTSDYLLESAIHLDDDSDPIGRDHEIDAAGFAAVGDRADDAP